MKKILLIILCVMNLMTITYFSAQDAATSTQVSETVTKKIIEPIIKKNPNSALKKNAKECEKFIRSLAHFVLFLTLGALIRSTLKAFEIERCFWYALIFCIIYALFDESLQHLLEKGRTFQFEDLLKDWSGSLVGIILTSLMSKSFVKEIRLTK